jgi:phospholipid/cholesterol/gamma-HCH transport system substrate-binding protein
MSREARVGIFVLLGLIVLTFFTFRVSKWGLIAEKGYRLTVDFDTAAGLEPKSDVKMAGVPIGKVEEIQLVGNRARLVMRIHKEIRIPIDSVASIQTQGLLGEKYVEILPGKDAQRNLPTGGQVANTLSPTNLDEMARKLSAIGDDVKKFTETLSATFGTEEGKKALGDILRDFRATSASLRTVVQGNEERFGRILENIDRLSESLSDISSVNKEDVRATIANLRAFSETLKTETPELARKLEEMSERVSGVVGDNRENLKESIQNLKTASAKLDNTLEAAGNVMAKIDRGEGTLGKLVNDNTAVNSLTESLDGINRYFRRYDALRMTIVPWTEFQTSTSDWKYYMNLKIQPTADKYYVLGVVNSPQGKRSVTNTTTTITPPPPGGTGQVQTQLVEYSNDWLFNAIIAKQFSRFTLYGGVLESTGGFGASYDVVKNRFNVGAEVFDFNRPDNRAHVKLYGNYDIINNFFITGGADDILNRDPRFRTPFIGFGIKFPDDDLKYVTGAVPLRP